MLLSLIGFLQRHLPFSVMDPAHLDFLARRLRTRYFAKGSRLTNLSADGAESLFIIKQGRVEIRGAHDTGASPTHQLEAGSCFMLESAVAQAGSSTACHALADTFCLELEHEGMTKLLEMSHPFRDFHEHLRTDGSPPPKSRLLDRPGE